MGQQSGGMGGKAGTPPNPNYGGSGGVDNSNGVYNAGVQSSAQSALASPTLTPPAGATGTTDPATAVGATGATTTASATLAPQGGYSPTTPGNTKGQAGGNKAGQPPVPGYPTANNTMTTDATLAANQRPAEYTDYDGKDHTADKAAWDAWNAKQNQPATTAAAPAGLPPGMAALAQNKAQSKGGTPPSAQGGMIGGMANATNPANAGAPTDYAAQSGRFNAQNDPTGGWAKMYNQQAQGKAAAAAAPTWMKNLMTGVGADGSTNESRAAADLAGNPIQTNKTYTNWESAVKGMTGQSDPWKALADAYKTAGAGQSAQMNQANIHRALLNSGINKETADRLHEMFASGTDHAGAARRLGVSDKWLEFTGASQADKDRTKELADWHKANPTGTVAPPPGATGTVTTAGATGATGAPLVGGRTATTSGTAPVAAAAAAAASEMPPGMDQTKLTALAKSYGVTPEIALQIYKQMLGQSQSSGGGNYGGSGGGAGGDGSSGGGGDE